VLRVLGQRWLLQRRTILRAPPSVRCVGRKAETTGGERPVAPGAWVGSGRDAVCDRAGSRVSCPARERGQGEAHGNGDDPGVPDRCLH
jgi:hypothetical protein